jgi:hypothetical protein
VDTVVSRLTIFFEGPFWVGVYERASDGMLEAAKVTFGDEPKDYEVYDYFLTHWSRLVFSPPVAGAVEEAKSINPKRLQREVHKAVSETGIGTKAQQALKLQYEQNKASHKQEERKKTEEERNASLSCVSKSAKRSTGQMSICLSVYQRH